MPDRSKTIRVLLVVYFVASIAIAVPLVFYVNNAGNLSGTTSGRSSLRRSSRWASAPCARRVTRGGSG